MRKRFEWGWETLDECTMRAKVIGGWIVHCDNCSSVFISDVHHEWEIMTSKNNVETDIQPPESLF